MNKDYFKKQIDSGAKMFFYAIEDREENALHMKSIKIREELDRFPEDYRFVREMTEGIPVFTKENDRNGSQSISS